MGLNKANCHHLTLSHTIPFSYPEVRAKPVCMHTDGHVRFTCGQKSTQRQASGKKRTFKEQIECSVLPNCKAGFRVILEMNTLCIKRLNTILKCFTKSTVLSLLLLFLSLSHFYSEFSLHCLLHIFVVIFICSVPLYGVFANCIFACIKLCLLHMTVNGAKPFIYRGWKISTPLPFA